MNNKGVTIIELLIYIVLFAIVSVLIGRQFNALINKYSSGKRVSSQQTDTRDILGLMVREIRNTGLKTFFTGTGISIAKQTADGVAVSATDLSSFEYVNTTASPFNDKLIIRRATLDNTGNVKGVEKIAYYLDGTTLKRDYTLISGAGGNDGISTVAANVHALQFQYGVLAANDLLFDQDPLTSPSNNWTSGGSPAPDPYGTSDITLPFSGASSGYLKYPKNNPGFTVNTNRKYSVILKIDPLGGFPGNLTSMTFSFRDAGRTTIYGSETFKPYSTGATMTITVPVHTGSATSAAFAYLDYTSSGAGTLLVKGVEVRCSELGAYVWKDAPTDAERLNTRAIKVFVLTRSSEKTGTKTSSNLSFADVTFPRSGEYTWRLFSETIETPNNGVF